jgi:thiol-disulfide isomerase/thioredoxin
MRTLFVTLCGLAVAFTGTAAETSRPSPAFSVLLAGNPAPPPIQISQYKGKVVLLAFIATTCPHCQDLTQKLKPLAQEYAPRGVQVIECAFNDDAEHLVTAFNQQFQPGFPVGWNNRMAVMNYLQWSILDTRPLYVP